MSIRSPKSPSFPSMRGFQPLGQSNSKENQNPNMAYSSSPPDQVGIPLTAVGTRSSSTGARKPGEGLLSSSEMNSVPTFRDDEKKGLFKRHQGPGGRRKVKKVNSKPVRRGTDGEEISINGLGRFYNKVVNFSVVTRYLVYVAPVAMLIAIPIVIFAVLHRDDLFFTTNVKVWIFWTWIEVVWLSIWVSKLVSKAIPYVFMFLCGVVSSGTRKYALILKAVEIPLSLVGWSVTSLVTFTALTNAKLNGVAAEKHWVNVMKALLGPCLIASILYLIEKMLIQLISINYHRRSFEGRIKESKRSVHLLGLLFQASRTLFPMYCPEFREEDYLISDGIEVMLANSLGTPGHKRSGSATPMRLIGNIGRVGDKVTSVFGNIASEITGKQVFNPNSAHSVVVEALEKTRSSEALAKRLWMSFVVEGREALLPEDVEEVLGPARKDEAVEAFSALDNDSNGDISLDEMIMKVVEIGRDRKAISASMRDVGQAIGVLDQVLVAILFIIVIFIFVAFQDTNFVTTLATAGTTLLSLSFVFAATTQEFLGSCIFLFVKHPYDVGDRVDIVGPVQEYLVVEQISLLFTIFKRIDSMKMVQVPNIILNNLWIENITRSKAMKEQLDMFISFDTSLEDIETLRGEMEAFVRHPDNSRDFQSDIILEATGIGNMDKLNLKIEIRHKSNWHNETVRAARRSKFMCALVLALRKVPIYGPGGGGEPLGGATNPGYSVAVPDSFAVEAREKAAAAKEGKRLVPTKKSDGYGDVKSSGTDLGSKTEAVAASQLNQRRPTEDSSAAWGARDDVTLGSSREHSQDHIGPEDRKRSQDIDDLKQTLLKRESTRGRRKPGEHVPAVPDLTAAYPSMSLTPADERGEISCGGQKRDEEMALGINTNQTSTTASTSRPAYTTNDPRHIPLQTVTNTGAGMGMGYGANGGLSANPYTPYTIPQSSTSGAQQQQSGGYSMFPPPGREGLGAGQAGVVGVVGGQSGGGSGAGQAAGGAERTRKLSLGFKNSSHSGAGQ